jgi:hypothetical protein
LEINANHGHVTFLAGMALLVPGSTPFLISGPSISAPNPALVVVPGFLLGVPAALLPAIPFFAWNPALFKGSKALPRRTYILFIATVVLTAIWFAAGWKFGIQYQGAHYTRVVCMINALWIAALGGLLVRYRGISASFASNVAVHWLLFVWFAWYAFPYLGEFP